MLNPLWRHHAGKRRTEVAGGVFEATHSGRQLEPLWAEPVEAIPGPREAAYSESYRAEGAPAAEQERAADEVGAAASARARTGATATGATATGSRAPGSPPPTESGPTGSGWPRELILLAARVGNARHLAPAQSCGPQEQVTLAVSPPHERVTLAVSPPRSHAAA
jgi:hypothetical protein